MHALGNEHLSKAEWRDRLTRARADQTAESHAREASALVSAVSKVTSGTVCAYLPFGTEPGTAALVDALAAGGARVLLPVIVSRTDPLDWAEYTGEADLVPSRFRGIREPGGKRLGSEAVGAAGLILVPALAVDHRGIRLGRGAGHYDRSLVFAAPGAVLLAVVRDEELVERLPGEPHDVRMSAALTPGRGVLELPM
ncbi:5-formyltetrahydrofolate cyclo-ligase [Amycolatopsis sp. SID8362]|uniref:5-formyltetrahydrofolate cyclo-ligase n=1 Tax=Amycolatopsis sp. SID8362 TaxID=2690346 RepID=UPI001370C7E8|nr:5-formyltetrahydrofolate cyclo-ligase [Amycolatopsis sp. SID8362]NBH07113.1 5-formyltetrahydrofolate cyclo-ligase [Amycolatopsis sp. SID8362]NED43810.1 5-formyltetrahydrofolate cyclo-ligase [Amycolatopsis sp. SID8362]